MRIQWSSEAAQDVLNRLSRAQRGMDEALRQAFVVDKEFRDANPDNDNDALTTLEERFCECRVRLNILARQLDEFRDAVGRSDSEFEEAEYGIRAAAAGLDTCTAPGFNGGYGANSTNRSYAGYSVMPEMRTNAGHVPDWLNALSGGGGVL